MDGCEHVSLRLIVHFILNDYNLCVYAVCLTAEQFLKTKYF